VTTIWSVIIDIEQNGARASIPIARVSTLLLPIANFPPGISTELATGIAIKGKMKKSKRHRAKGFTV
jgi:hypothetical protein